MAEAPGEYSMVEALIFVVFPFCMLFAAISDTLSMTIANRVPLLLAGAFFIAAPLTGMDLATFGWHIAAGMSVLIVTFILFAMGGMGGGDAKLLAVTSLWMGMGFSLLEYLAGSAVLGGILTVAILSFRASPLAVFAGNNIFLRNFTSTADGVPYAIALGAGGLIAFSNSPLALWAVEQLTAR